MSARLALGTVRLGPATKTGVRLGLAVEVTVAAAIVGLAVWLRMLSLGDPTDLSDEGIRGIQLRLLAAGYRPVSEIYASQGPLSLWLFYPAVALFGPEILVGRMTVVVTSVLTLLGTAWIARMTAGPIAGLAAGLVLALSPVFLDNSRLAFVEVPSIAPTVLGLISLLTFRGTGRRVWLTGSALLLAVGALAKPMAAIAGLPALVLLLAPTVGVWRHPDDQRRPWRARLLDLGLFTLAGLVVCGLVVLSVGPTILYEQVVTYRLQARAARGWDLATNASLVAEQLRLNGWGVLLASGVGVVSGLWERRALGLAAVAWLAGGLVALLAYSPLWEKHVTYVMPPLALLAGIGFARLGALMAGPRDWSRLSLGGAAAVALALVAAYLPTLASETRAIVYRHAGSDYTRYADDLAIVQAATAPGDFVVVDDAYLSMLTGRLTPPSLADLSTSRIQARALSADQTIAETGRFGAKVLILQDDHLGGVQRYLAWADREYVLVKSYAQRRPARFRRVYAQPVVDLAPVKEAVRGSLSTSTEVRIGPAGLLGYELDRREIKAGSRFDLTLMFEALQNRPPEHALITRLRDRSGQSAWEGEWKVGDGGQELHTWQAGRWQAQTLRLLVEEIPEGAYTLTVALQRPNGNAAPVTATSGARAWPTGDEVDLGEVRVVR